MPSEPLLLGIEGGATKTVAWLAAGLSGGPRIAGRGRAGPANFQAVGAEAALANLDRAVDDAMAQAGHRTGQAAAAVLAAAGSDRDENRQVLMRWADARRLARRFRVVHDALPVLAAGSPEGWGVALISGTGSLAFAQDRDGRTARCGGWGYLFGDEGSGYAVAVAGLRATARSADGRSPQTALLPAMLGRLGLERPEQLVATVYRWAGDRAAVAALAEVVVRTADEGDKAAARIVEAAADELAAMASGAARKAGLAGAPFALAMAGGVLANSALMRRAVEARLQSLGLRADPVAVVGEPVLGAVLLAQSDAQRGGGSGPS